MRYVGITGFMSRAEVDACLEALPEGLTLMCGVLVSGKTLRGERNRWWRRYPQVEDIAGIFSDDPRCLNLIHYCSDTPPDWRTLSRLHGFGGERLHGFQFNGAWPTEFIYALTAEDRLVLQVRPLSGVTPETRAFDAAGVAMKVGSWKRDLHVLLDGSGGEGKNINVDVVGTYVRAFGQLAPHVRVGIAGGLCAETLPAVAPLVREYELSVDAEGRLRDGEEGGALNLDKARAYLRAAGEVMR